MSESICATCLEIPDSDLLQDTGRALNQTGGLLGMGIAHAFQRSNPALNTHHPFPYPIGNPCSQAHPYRFPLSSEAVKPPIGQGLSQADFSFRVAIL